MSSGGNISSTMVRNIPRAGSSVVETLRRFGVSTVYEAQGGTGLMRPYLRPIYHGPVIAGPAVTVSCATGDNLMLHAGLDICVPGDVLVVSTTSDSDHGMFGSLLGLSSQVRGVVALVIDAGVRDVSELTAMRFPVWAKLISAKGTTKNGPGSVNVPIECAGVCVQPGDVIVADSDGVVVVSAKSAESVASAATERHEHEQRVRERLKCGESTLDILGLRARLDEFES
jgi:4-hydroxy-4-methyl-2-oxoglutarate aldolase